MSKHTPGPWAVEGDSVYANRDARSRHRNGRACVANVCAGDYDELDAEGKANAALIAAAPDLLAVAHRAVCLIVEEYGESSGNVGAMQDLAEFRKVIAKAEGSAQ